jgi:Flp pilus assembly secretin CpaC
MSQESTIAPASLSREISMDITTRRVAGLAGMLLMAVLTPSASAQTIIRIAPQGAPLPGITVLRTQNTVAVPDGGTALIGSYSRVSEARNEFGTPGIGKLPVAGRLFRNVGVSRQVQTIQASASVRIIDLAEEEYRQTGVRSR